MKYLALALALTAAACANGAITPEAKATLCHPKGIYFGELLNPNWDKWSAEDKAAYRRSVDILRIANCPDPVALGYGDPA